MSREIVTGSMLDDLLVNISGVVDFDIELPDFVFKRNFDFYFFFERPLLTYSGLLVKFINSIDRDVYLKFDGLERGSCFRVRRGDVAGDVESLSKMASDFDGGNLGYPLVISDESCDLVAIEGASEEFGVLAMDDSLMTEGVREIVGREFIGVEDFARLVELDVPGSLAARLFLKNYFNVI